MNDEEKAANDYARRSVDVHNDPPETSLRAFLAGVKWARENAPEPVGELTQCDGEDSYE